MAERYKLLKMNEDGVSKVAKVLEDLISRQSSSQVSANNVTTITTLSKTLLNLNVYSKSIHKWIKSDGELTQSNSLVFLLKTKTELNQILSGTHPLDFFCFL